MKRNTLQYFSISVSNYNKCIHNNFLCPCDVLTELLFFKLFSFYKSKTFLFLIFLTKNPTNIFAF